ncbi:hypothetical protein [Bacteroides sp.]|uniref:hypothetical protein n=1 Tax=Bacteroides sp. TaxID=29523 RepID=UPI0025903997|nr:hypothetical protein [Bacteroides sp.]
MRILNINLEILRSLFFTSMIGMCLIACNGENELEDGNNTPGIITAQKDVTLMSYAVSGAILLPINVENSGVELSKDNFTYDNFSITTMASVEDEEEIKFEDKLKLPVLSVEKGEGNSNVLVFGYDFTGYTSCSISFTLGYAGTETSIPVSIKIEDDLKNVNVSHIGAGMNGLLTWNSDFDSSEEPQYDFLALKGTGLHANNISFKNLDGEDIVMLDDNFEFTTEELGQGYASIPVEADFQCKNGSTFRIYTSFSVCASCVLSPVTIGRESRSYIWKVEEEAEFLGMDKNNYDYIWFMGREYEFYISTKGGYLKPAREYSVISSIGDSGTVGEKQIPYIKLELLNKLSPGEYMLVAHIKKLLRNPDDKQYVDFCIPFVKE